MRKKLEYVKDLFFVAFYGFLYFAQAILCIIWHAMKKLVGK